jgi:hypothetical protein
VSDVVGERLSFARPSSGDNENRSLASHRRCLLLRIQIIQPRKFGWNTFVNMLQQIDQPASFIGRNLSVELKVWVLPLASSAVTSHSAENDSGVQETGFLNPVFFSALK